MEPQTIQDALDYCLVNPDNLSAQELLARFPEYRRELGPLLALSTGLRGLNPPPVPDARRTAMKQRLMQAAGEHTNGDKTTGNDFQAIPIGARARSSVPGTHSSTERKGVLVAWAARPAWVGLALAAAMVLFLWFASANSLPDSPLYKVKLTSENVMLNFAGVPAGQAEAHLDLANARLADLRKMEAIGKLAQAGPALSNYEYHLNSGVSIWQQLSGEQYAEVAKRLYTSSVAGERTFSNLEASSANLTPSMRTNIEEASASAQSAQSASADALTTQHIDPNTLPTPDVPAAASISPGPPQQPKNSPAVGTSPSGPASSAAPPPAKRRLLCRLKKRLQRHCRQRQLLPPAAQPRITRRWPHNQHKPGHQPSWPKQASLLHIPARPLDRTALRLLRGRNPDQHRRRPSAPLGNRPSPRRGAVRRPLVPSYSFRSQH